MMRYSAFNAPEFFFKNRYPKALLWDKSKGKFRALIATKVSLNSANIPLDHLYTVEDYDNW